MEEKKINKEPLEDEKLSDVNGGYYSVAGSVIPNLENTVASGSYAAARASVGVHVGAVNEADAIRQDVPVIGMNQTIENLLAGRTPQHTSSVDDTQSVVKWKGNEL